MSTITTSSIKKPKRQFVCIECGTVHVQWAGKCSGCGEWNTLEEHKVSPVATAASNHQSMMTATVQSFADHTTTNQQHQQHQQQQNRIGVGSTDGQLMNLGDAVKRIPKQQSQQQHPTISSNTHIGEWRYRTGLSEFDRVMGGGVVDGSLVLIGGEPGIGKSTLLFQVCKGLAKAVKKRFPNRPASVLYISGEESENQLSLRAKRMGLFEDTPESTDPNPDSAAPLYILCETHFEAIEAKVRSMAEKPKVIIVDSIQTCYTAEIATAPGTMGQLRAVCDKFMAVAKRNNIVVFLIGHVTKEGSIAGPKSLEHMVDVVLYFDSHKRSDQYRMLRNYKNRFGATHEVGIFEMRDRGLVSLDKPSQVFLQEKPDGVAGSVIAATLEGSRALLVEVQALLVNRYSKAFDDNYSDDTQQQQQQQFSGRVYGKPKTIGVDYQRVSMIAAVIERKLGLRISNQDMYVNVVGGVKLEDTATDLAVCAALLSSASNCPLPSSSVFFGEVGLAGEVRSVASAESRIMESYKMGVTTVYLPRANHRHLSQSLPKSLRESIQWKPIGNISELSDYIISANNSRSKQKNKS